MRVFGECVAQLRSRISAQQRPHTTREYRNGERDILSVVNVALMGVHKTSMLPGCTAQMAIARDRHPIDRKIGQAQLRLQLSAISWHSATE